jgi:hypothetical protein
MHYHVHVPSQQILGSLIAKQTQARRVAERAIALQIETADSFCGRVQKQQIFFFTLVKGLFGSLLARDIDPNTEHVVRPVVKNYAVRIDPARRSIRTDNSVLRCVLQAAHEHLLNCTLDPGSVFRVNPDKSIFNPA